MIRINKIFNYYIINKLIAMINFNNINNYLDNLNIFIINYYHIILYYIINIHLCLLNKILYYYMIYISFIILQYMLNKIYDIIYIIYLCRLHT